MQQVKVHDSYIYFHPLKTVLNSVVTILSN